MALFGMVTMSFDILMAWLTKRFHQFTAVPYVTLVRFIVLLSMIDDCRSSLSALHGMRGMPCARGHQELGRVREDT
jgi:hypothetical protein